MLHNIPDELCRLQDKWESCVYAEEREETVKTFIAETSFTELGMYLKKLENIEEEARALLSGKSKHGEMLRESLKDLHDFRTQVFDETRRRKNHEVFHQWIEELSPTAEAVQCEQVGAVE
ncbi:MAG: hypothetical protein K2W95_15655 [Candidatus Obscuribacterales bacterium]|nr:hypothetical protein [Candidatus Obscuribacterales bacterium]